MHIKRILFWAAIAVAVYFVINNPNGAGNLVQNGFASLGNAADAVIAFLNKSLS